VSTQLVSECKPSAYQPIKADKNMYVVALRPHLYIHGNPTGNVKVQIQDANGYMIAESATETIANLKTLGSYTLDYVHGYFRFYVSTSLIDQVSYRLAVVCGGGYSFSESNYVGICLDWDDTKISLNYTPVNKFQHPLDFEIWERLTK